MDSTDPGIADGEASARVRGSMSCAMMTVMDSPTEKNRRTLISLSFLFLANSNVTFLSARFVLFYHLLIRNLH